MADNLESLVSRAEAAEKEVELLFKELQTIKQIKPQEVSRWV